MLSLYWVVAYCDDKFGVLDSQETQIELLGTPLPRLGAAFELQVSWQTQPKMMFGRVEAFVTPGSPGMLRLSVTLESGARILTVRDGEVGRLIDSEAPSDLAWQADQYAQETIANELALDGWEVIGAGDIPEVEDSAFPRSASYAVRRLS